MLRRVKKIFSAVLTTAIVLSLFVMPVAEAESINGWNFTYRGTVDATVEVDDTEASVGKSSMKIVNRSTASGNVYFIAGTNVSLQAGKSYVVSMQVKAKDANILRAMFNWGGVQNLAQFGTTFNWKKFEWVYRPAETKLFEFQILVEGVTGGVWIDDVKIIDEETGENLVSNPGFEGVAEASAEASEDVLDDSAQNIYNKITSSESYSEEEMLKVRGAFKYMPVYKGEGIVVDGDPQDWGDFPEITVPTLPTQYMIYIDDGRVKDVLSKVKCAYDEQKFYFYIEVEDDIFTSFNGEDTYWKGDSIQMAISSTDEVYGSELGFSYDPVADKGSVYGNGFSSDQKEKIELKASQSGNKTVYEASIPWNLKFIERPSQIYLNYLVNDNDGDGRRYCAELAPKGISEYKSNKDCPLLEMQDSMKTWYGWIQGERSGIAGDASAFDWYLVNSGDEDREFTVSSELTGTSEIFTVPAHSGIRREIKKVFDAPGTYKADIKISSGEEESTSSIAVSIAEELPTPEEAAAIKEDMVKKSAEIRRLLDSCEKKGISADYELVNWRVMDRFTQYIQDDINAGELDRINYTEDCLNELYEEAKINLNSYLSGEKTPFVVPHYITSDVTFKDRTSYALNEIDGTIEERPTFFVGYGHFTQARSDIPVFNEFGVNAIQNEIGPRNAMVKGSGWTTQGSGGGIVTTVTDDVKVGQKALSLSYTRAVAPNVYTSLYFTVTRLEAGKTYELKGWIKANDVNSGWMSANNWSDRVSVDGTYDWKEFTIKYVCPEGVTSTVVRVNTDGPAKQLLLDGLTFTESGSDEDLLEDGSFEEYGKGEWKINLNPGTSVDAFCKMLESAEQNNISVSVLISPHYFFDDVVKEYNIGISGGFFNYNVNAPIAREITEKYVSQFLPLIKDYKSISSICITNEPHFWVDTAADGFYLEPWREFLKAEYGEIEKLNKLWGTNYKSFDECDFAGYQENPTKYYDYKIFNDQTLASYHIWLADLVRKYAPGIPVHSKTMPYVGDRPQGARANDGSSLLYNYTAYDIMGCDAFNLIDDNKGPLQKIMWYDYISSYKDGPIINTEDHITGDRNDDYRRDAADYMSQDIYQGAIHGRFMSTIWVWERTYDKTSSFRGSVLFRPDAVAKISKANLDLNRLSYEITSLQNEIPEVAICYSDSDLINNESFLHAAYQAYCAAMFSGKVVRFITDVNMGTINDYKLVIVPTLKYVSPEMVNAIGEYINNGGNVIVMGKKDVTLSMDKRTEPQKDMAMVQHIINNSYFIDYEGTASTVVNMKPTEIYDLIRNKIAELGLYYVKVIDTATGEAADDIEYNIGVNDNKVIVNLSNYGETKDVKLYLGDRPVTKALELRSGEAIGEVITAEKYVPITLEVETDYVFFDSYGHWAEEYITKLHKEGVIHGRSESRYDPDGTITRWEFHALLSRAAGKELPEYDSDSESFRPNDKITREEMCEMLVTYYEAVNGQIDGNVQLAFTDEVKDTESVSKAVSAGLMLGRKNGTFDGNGTATRGEAAAVISRFAE